MNSDPENWLAQGETELTKFATIEFPQTENAVSECFTISFIIIPRIVVFRYTDLKSEGILLLCYALLVLEPQTYF